MKVATVKAGDIVDVDKKGRRFLARVRRRFSTGKGARTQFEIEPLGRENYGSATSGEIVGIYRKVKGSL